MVSFKPKFIKITESSHVKQISFSKSVKIFSFCKMWDEIEICKLCLLHKNSPSISFPNATSTNSTSSHILELLKIFHYKKNCSLELFGNAICSNTNSYFFTIFTSFVNINLSKHYYVMVQMRIRLEESNEDIIDIEEIWLYTNHFSQLPEELSSCLGLLSRTLTLPYQRVNKCLCCIMHVKSHRHVCRLFLILLIHVCLYEIWREKHIQHKRK